MLQTWKKRKGGTGSHYYCPSLFRQVLMAALGSYHRCCSPSAVVYAILAVVMLPRRTRIALAAGANATPCATAMRSTEAVHHWGFRGGGYHMRFEVEFPLRWDEVHISIDLPRAFFFDAVELQQLYTVTSQECEKDITSAYKPLHFSSDFFFDIEAPAFRIKYDINRVNITLERKPSSMSKNNQEGGALHDSCVINADSKGLLVVPIHARYEEVDATTPFSLRAFFSRTTQVRRCVPVIAVHGSVVSAEERCIELTSATMVQYEGTTSQSPPPSPVADADGVVEGPSPGCRNIPVALLSSLPVVYGALALLHCIGVVIVVLPVLVEERTASGGRKK
uniref:WGS project CAEQ00000000 data, annotated contig 591 n=1 Tax=Trypanosoma congolense (strain IL3000) TaxID=1068625 RepID=F9WH43_TRYCI|nr:unnamed protein product [Trypanosoma congolense IL3000]